VSRAVLSIGSNVGDRLAHLRSAVAGLGDVVVGVSPVYETAPWGGVEQDDYLNAVVVVDEPGVDAVGWMERARALEVAAGRVRGVRWGPRTLDVDLVTVDGATSADPELTLPHPRAHLRAFVLRPWLDLQPYARLPGHGFLHELIRAPDVAADLGAMTPRPELDLTSGHEPVQE
jgi:2-amino-4-hydroxy-6-hydroxymethyldihydropteridine diphosphokinase